MCSVIPLNWSYFLFQVHERDQDTDFSLLIVRKLLRTNSRHVKVVLMSATFDCDLFAQYFALPVRDCLEPAPVVTVDEAPHTVSEYYVEDFKELGQVQSSLGSIKFCHKKVEFCFCMKYFNRLITCLSCLMKNC